MKTVFIHIGHIKTGTTAIQSMFARERAHFLEHGLLYPSTGIPVDIGGEVEHLAHHLLCNDLSVGLGPFERECVAYRWQALRREIDDSPAGKVFVSSEMLSYGSPELPWIAKDALKGLDVRVMYCVRRQDTLIRSAYLQMVKDGMDDGEVSFLDYVQKSADSFCFGRHVEPWAKAFGKSSIHCFLYERQKDVRATVLSLIDPELTLPEGRDASANLTLGPEYVAMLRRIHRLELSAKQKNELIGELSRMSLALSPKASVDACSLPLEIYWRCYAQDNRAFASTWLPEEVRAYFAYERDALSFGGHLQSRLARLFASPGAQSLPAGGGACLATTLASRKDKDQALRDYAREVGEAYGCRGEIFDADENFRFVLEHPCFETPQEAIDYYFKDGQRSAKQLCELVRNHGLQPERSQLLEISVGAGCVARHFSGQASGMAVTSAQTSPDAAEFVRDVLKLDVLEMSFDPASLPGELSFDAVLALSFFTQLSRHGWEQWLAGLFRSLRPGGLLIFTTHGQISLPELSDPEVPADGFWHQPGFGEESESGRRGLTVSLRTFVEQTCQRVLGVSPLECREGFWFKHQDVYVLRRPEDMPSPDIS